MSVVRRNDAAPSPLRDIAIRDAVNRAMDALGILDRVDVIAAYIGAEVADPRSMDRMAVAMMTAGWGPED